MKSKRQEYMEAYSPASEEGRRRLHETYYGYLVEALGEEALRRLVPATREVLIMALETDPALNNISLRLWDSQHSAVWQLVKKAGGTEALAHITGPGGWSLSDSVCTLKEAARRWATAPLVTAAPEEPEEPEETESPPVALTAKQVQVTSWVRHTIEMEYSQCCAFDGDMPGAVHEDNEFSHDTIIRVEDETGKKFNIKIEEV